MRDPLFVRVSTVHSKLCLLQVSSLSERFNQITQLQDLPIFKPANQCVDIVDLNMFDTHTSTRFVLIRHLYTLRARNSLVCKDPILHDVFLIEKPSD